MRRLTASLAAGGALLILPSQAGAQSPADQCMQVPNAAGIELLIAVEGAPGRYRLTCREGAIVAVPAGPDGAQASASAPGQSAESVARTALSLIGISPEADAEQSAAGAQPSTDQTGASETEMETGNTDTGDAGDAGSGDMAAPETLRERAGQALDRAEAMGREAASEARAAAERARSAASDSRAIAGEAAASIGATLERSATRLSDALSGDTSTDDAAGASTDETNVTIVDQGPSGSLSISTTRQSDVDQDGSDGAASAGDSSDTENAEAAIEESASEAADMLEGTERLDTPPDALTDAPAAESDGASAGDGDTTAPAADAASDADGSASDADGVGTSEQAAEAEEAIEESASEAAAMIDGTDQLDTPPESLEAESDADAGEDGTDMTRSGDSPALRATPNEATAGTGALGAPLPDVATVDRSTGTTDAPPVIGEPASEGEAGAQTAGADAMNDSASTETPSEASEAMPATRERMAAARPEATDPLASSAPGEAEGREMVRVPARVLANARLAVPGARFSSVSLREDDDGRVYALGGASYDGIPVSVVVEPNGDVVSVDREIAPASVPASILRIADGFLQTASVDRVMLSTRDNHSSYFVFEGADAGGMPFALQIRSDGRSVQFERRN